MRNRYWIVLAAAAVLPALAADAQAQDMEIGFKLGAAIANFTNPPEPGEPEPESITTFGGGGHIRFALTQSISLQPELLFMRKGFQVPGATFDTGVDLDYAEIPLLVRLDIPAGGVVSPFAYAGPYAAFEVACSVRDAPGDDECGDHESFDYGAVFGAGVGFAAGPGKVVLEGRYDLGLQNLSPEDEPEQKNRAFGFFVGYAVPLGR